MSRFAILPFAALALSGCAGSVSLEEVDGFGAVASSVWLFDDDGDYHQILLTNVVGACDKYTALYEAAEEFEDAFSDLELDDYDDYCEIMEEPTLNLARAYDALQHEGAHWLTLSLRDDGDSEPDDQKYEVGDDPSVSGSLVYVENNPFAAYLADYDPDDDAEDNCGVDEDDLEIDTDYYYLSDGELEITAVNDEANTSGRFEGELEDDNGNGEGDITFSFTASYCEVG